MNRVRLGRTIRYSGRGGHCGFARSNADGRGLDKARRPFLVRRFLDLEPDRRPIDWSSPWPLAEATWPADPAAACAWGRAVDAGADDRPLAIAGVVVPGVECDGAGASLAHRARAPWLAARLTSDTPLSCLLRAHTQSRSQPMTQQDAPGLPRGVSRSLLRRQEACGVDAPGLPRGVSRSLLRGEQNNVGVPSAYCSGERETPRGKPGASRTGKLHR